MPGAESASVKIIDPPCREFVVGSDYAGEAANKRTDDMKYILLMNTMKAGDYGLATWPKEDQQAHLAYWNSLNKELAEAGELVVVHGLAAPPFAEPWCSARAFVHGTSTPDTGATDWDRADPVDV